MNNIHISENNKEQWERLIFSLEERDKPTLIVIGFDSFFIQKEIYRELENNFSQYRFHTLDLSAESIESLNRALIDNLPGSILNSEQVEYIVNVFGLENSLFSIMNNRIESTSLTQQLNLEREILFQEYPFVIIIWTDSYTVDILKKEAKDLWDWVTYHFNFETEDEQKNILNAFQDGEVRKTRIFLSYAREDYEAAAKLHHDLKKAGFQPWLDRKNLLPGQKWKSEISKAIKESSFFLALLSSNSLRRGGYVHKELKAAMDILDEFPSDAVFVIPVYIEPCEPSDGRLGDIEGVNVYPSYEEGLKRILRAFHLHERGAAEEAPEFLPVNKKRQSETVDRIVRLQEKYDAIKLDDSLRERVIKEKINIQKLLGREYMKLKMYEKAERSFRIALALGRRIDDFEHEKEEISFLLNQVFYQPPKTG